ncbi:ABC transporter permease [Basilea psittacipulmonis]|uniref:Transport permease protein n=1 Tax=Basilea psittacipulmonis DSM 24701 TaxID=1072685 RepID=A0A077DER3_9BURK|nr:ABC transporter permease [Basilea psittacipulmonis]AIL33325.1 metal-dependent hydrolase [Basilea psittacipulmonis DSM 24701]
MSSRVSQRFSSGFPTLLYKEMMRYLKVSTQTIAAPVVTALLYLLVFSQAMKGKAEVYGSVPYLHFLIPGLMMMSMLQNSFANTSSSLIQSRITGNLVFILLPPFSYWEIFSAYIVAACARGLCVGLALWVASCIFAVVIPVSPIWLIIFSIMACAIMSSLGLVAGVWSEKFDHLAAFQNFLIMPATFLSGVFYSVHSLPPFWQTVSHWNPLFYTIDGFRYGFFGIADVSPWHSFAVVLLTLLITSAIALRMLATGYKLRY